MKMKKAMKLAKFKACICEGRQEMLECTDKLNRTEMSVADKAHLIEN